MELEEKLRAEYQTQLDAKSAEIEICSKKREEQQAVIDRQLEEISRLSTEATANKRIEQLNRELNNTNEKLQTEVAAQKARIKALQKDLAEERSQVKALKQFDAPAMKKNLDATKKKLAERATANDLLQKSVNKYRNENTEMKGKVSELEAKLAELEPVEEAEETAAA